MIQKTLFWVSSVLANSALFWQDFMADLIQRQLFDLIEVLSLGSHGSLCPNIAISNAGFHNMPLSNINMLAN
jgi:hypothetical protein